MKSSEPFYRIDRSKSSAPQRRLTLCCREPRRSWPPWVLLLAAVLLLASCATDPRVSEIAQEYYNLGNIYYEMGEYERSYQFYTRAQELDPDVPASSYNLARLELERGNLQRAVEVLTELREEEPENLIILETLAYARNKQGRRQRAIELYRSILEQDPGRVTSLYNLSVLVGTPSEAITLLQRANELEPEDEEVLRRLVSLLAAEERPEAAVVYLERLRRLVSEDREALELVAERYEELDYPQEAVETYDILLEIAPGEARYHFSQARLLLTTIGDDRRGLTALEEALQRGFAEEAAIRELLGSEELVAPVEVEELLDERGLMPEDESAEDGEQNENGDAVEDESPGDEGSGVTTTQSAEEE